MSAPTHPVTHNTSRRAAGLTRANYGYIILSNTPAMPLNDAHSGGFFTFTSGACR